MPLSYEPAANRPKLNFGTEGLPAREELLLKSLIRLLDHRTKHQWTYHPESADLWIMAEGVKVPAFALAGKSAHKLLVLSTQRSSEDHVLTLPLNAEVLESTLNRFGNALTLALTKHTAMAPKASTDAVESFKLTRWPPADQVSEVQHIRMASTLLGKALTLAEMSQRSGYAQAACKNFIGMLRQSGLIETSHTAAAGLAPQLGAAVQEKSTSVFARIRDRLAQPFFGSKAR